MDAPSAGLLLSALLTGLVGLWLGYQFSQRKCQRRHQKLMQEFEALKKSDEELQLRFLNATYTAQEEERKRISNDLHDEIGAQLTFLKLNLQALYKGRRMADSRMIGEEQLFHDLFKIVDDVNTRNREIINDISPTTLEEFGLEMAVKKVLEQVNNSYTLHTKLETEGTSRRFNPRTELMLYRVVQELTTNALKYSDGWRLTVIFKWEESGLTLTVSQFDRIRSLNLGRDKKGLPSIQNRIKTLDASIKLVDNVVGTDYVITVPYERADN